MNNYIVLDGYRYVTPSNTWLPVLLKPASMKVTLNGTVDVTYGPAEVKEWQGQIEAPVTAPGVEWGTVTNLRATLAKRQAVVMYDHYGTGYNVHVLGPFQEKSIAHKWDSPSNKILFTTRIIKASVL